MNRVLIVEDQHMAQRAMEAALNKAKDRYELVDCISIAEDAINLSEVEDMQLILMDVCTGDSSSGIHVTKRIKKRFPRIKVIITTSMPEFRFIEAVKSAGADGFCYKNISAEELLDIMDRTMAGESIFPEAAPVVKIGKTDSSKITEREMEVLYLVVRGNTISESAKILNISESTVRTHLENLKEKTGCKSKLELAIMAVETGLVLPHYA